MERQEAHDHNQARTNATSYPFLNHSPTTLTHDLPPHVDNKPLARQRRKRTSPEDQAILEAAYRRDPKPDKDARLRLVEQIALGEKEVQIWFQNRRQTSRRKSRPLLPHEIAQFQMSRYGNAPLDLASGENSSHGADVRDSGDDDSGSALSSDPVHSADQLLSSDPQMQRSSPSAPLPTGQQHATPAGPCTDTQPPLNQRLMPSLQQILDSSSNTTRQDSGVLSFTGRPLKKASSFVRISMTSGGNAQVVTKDGFSPSPPRPERDAAAPSTQGTSGLDIADVPKMEPLSGNTSLKRSASGRSRDSRAWEFWCDKECRTELEDKAEKDGKGSAADAIGVIRAAMNRKALQPLPLKHNAVAGRHRLLSSRRSDPDAKRPALQRAHTSGGRLQNSGIRAMPADFKRTKLAKPSVLNTESSTYIPGNESDKENWSPGAEHAHDGQKKDQSVPFISGDRHSRRAHQMTKSWHADAENDDPDADDEVAAFMRKGGSSGSVSGVEELDCVQGLLSLSQGTWAA